MTGGEPAGFARARAVADAVLFEGYVLYPYRASAPKNRLRWQFGVLAPPGADSSETSANRTELLAVPCGAAPALAVRVRFLQAERRPDDGSGQPPWDEGVVREIDARTSLVDGAALTVPFRTDGERLSGVLRIDVSGTDQLLKVRLQVENLTPGPVAPRSEMLLGSLIGTHTLIAADRARLLSLADPPDWAAEAAAGCDNRHTWPVLLDDTTALASPIILEDRPRVSPESPADLYDATEIDELLMLRTLTLTDDEKREARATDARAAAVVDRAESLTGPELERLHGALRRTPEDDGGVAVPGGRAVPGTRVRLCPGSRRADAQDMFLDGRTARVAAVLHDFDGATHLAVTFDDDPVAELHAAMGRHWYFAPDEVELL
ncbi:hypothetical protein SRB5_02450 [Streptomyces sp. RB5]|uniref:Uncharacterized protein n=1 Tax=Streptomyces smaragdinus TaxID=2585196 RepID=A0A7K0C9L5_9ACTN|nr:hypothetical protein [Streptomyces smaragdinus]MQY10139.1 hypothetical protein [Streptomyces smaragdinus]